MKNKKIIIIVCAILLVVAVLLGVYLFWGDDIAVAINGEELYECVMVSDGESAKFDYKYTIYSDKKNKTVNKIEIKQEIESSQEGVIPYYSSVREETYKKANETYGGFDYNVETTDNKLSFELTINYKEVDMEKFLKDYKDYKEFVDKQNRIKTDGLLSYYEKEGYDCKPKEK